MKVCISTTASPAAAVLGTLLLLAGMPGTSRAAAPSALLGSVRDAVGNAVPGVEVLLVRPADPTTAIAETRSDLEGKFVLSDLIPGLYRVAAVKTGYRTFLGRVDTYASETLDLVLHPVAQIEADDVPRTSSWQLRLPRRPIFRETRPGAFADPLDGASGAGELRNAGALRMRFDQMFSIRGSGRGSRSGTSDLSASETGMLLASALGPRGSLRVRGSRGHFGTPDDADLVGSAASESTSSTDIDFSYATGLDSELAIRAFYDQADRRLSFAGDAAPFRRERTTWGYDASWSRQLDRDSHVAVRIDYHDLDVGDPEAARLPGAGTDPSGKNRAVGAQGSFARVADDRHEVQVALRARRIEPATRTGRALDPASPEVDGSVWNLEAEARDTFTVSAPLNIVYGVGYKRALVDRAETMIVPRLGGSWSMDGWLLSALLSHHSVRESGSADDRGAGMFRPQDALGYEARLEVPLTRGVLLSGDATYEPIRFAELGYVGDPSNGGPLYVTDGNAAVREQRLRLLEDRGATQTYLELSNGRAQGTLATLLPFDTSMRLASGRELRYSSGRFGLRVPGRGTQLVLEYQRVAADAEDAEEDRESIHEMVEVRLCKEMWNLVSAGDWRLLMAVRLGSVESPYLEEPGFVEGRQALNALNTRVSAGVSVAF